MKKERFKVLPRHVGVIMDGNGRWAKKRRLPRSFGHKAAIKAVRQVIETSAELGIQVLTLYAFSTENWNRPDKEVSFLMRLLEEFLKKELLSLVKNNIQFNLLGNRSNLPQFLQKPLEEAFNKTKKNTGLKLCLAIDYGGRAEITEATQRIADKVKNGELVIADITEETISHHLYTKDIPDPDLIIRTSGELRLSNFLLWQAAYAEFYFTDVLWPDFNDAVYYEALEDYAKRIRRRGQVHDTE